MALALTIARLATGWTGKELATAAGMAQSTLSQYESGKAPLTWERYRELLAVLSPDSDLAERALLSAKLVQPPVSTSGGPVPLTYTEARLVRKATALAGSEAVDVLRDGLTKMVQSERIRQDRERAQALWRRLKRYRIPERRILVEGAEDYHEWALSVLLCYESERATAHDPNEALALGELALLVAEKLDASERWRFRLSGQAWIFIGNARRVANQLVQANEAFGCGWHFWNAGEDTLGILDEGYLYDLEASLRRDERALVRDVRARSQRARNTLDFIRGLWLEGNLASALGARPKAMMLLEQVRRELLERQLPYDFALASLDLALVYREEKRYRDIKLLASEMVALFTQQGIHREAIGALILFQESVEAEFLTTEEVKRLQAYLERAQREPNLRFES